MQKAQIELRMHYYTPCSDAISGSKNRVCEIKSGHDFCRCIEALSRLSIFRSMVDMLSDLVYSYNHSLHRSIKTEPVMVNK